MRAGATTIVQATSIRIGLVVEGLLALDNETSRNEQTAR